MEYTHIIMYILLQIFLIGSVQCNNSFNATCIGYNPPPSCMALIIMMPVGGVITNAVLKKVSASLATCRH